MAQPSVHGRFIWQELLTSDTAGAAGFYPRVVDWRTQAASPPSPTYSIFAADSGAIAGLMPLPEDVRAAGARPHWLPYVGSDDVDATVAAAERLGGKVLRPATAIPEIGRYAVLADPQGAAFGVYRPVRAPAAAAKQPRRGEIAWQELAARDHEEAFRFYAELFGWQALQRMEMGPAGSYLIFGQNGVGCGGMYRLSAQTEKPVPYWLSYIEVSDADAVAASAQAAGGRVVNGPMDVPGGARIAQLLDPSGVLFAVHSRGAPAVGAAAGTAAHAHRPARPARSARPPAARRQSAPAAAAAEAPAPAPAARRPAKTARRRAVKKTAKKVAAQVARKTAGKAAKKATRRVAKKVAKKATAPRHAGRGSSRRASARSTGRRAKRAAQGTRRTAAARRGGRRRSRR